MFLPGSNFIWFISSDNPTTPAENKGNEIVILLGDLDNWLFYHCSESKSAKVLLKLIYLLPYRWILRKDQIQEGL